MNEAGKIKDFTDLSAWQEGHKLVLMVYSVTGRFPRVEIFGFTTNVEERGKWI